MITKSEKKGLKSVTASAVAAALLVTSPGPLATRAFAQLASGAAASGRATSALPGSLGASAGVKTLSPSLSAPTLAPTLSPSLVLPPVSAPSARAQAASPARAASANAAAVVAGPSVIRAAPAARSEAASILKAVAAESRAPAGARTVTSTLQRLAADVTKAFRPGAAPRTAAAASSLNAVFDRNTKAASVSDSLPVAGKTSRAAAALKPAASAALNECSGGGCSVPTPSKAAAHAKPSVWQHPLVKYGAPVAILGATVLFFQASLIPVAVISGSLMFSILAHESAHILGLRIWGDPSPKEAGRDHLNPFKHIDLFGTILLPAASMALSQAAIGFPILFGWAKPVPVDFNNLKDVQHDAAKVAALGPLTNLGLAGLAFGALAALPALGLISATGTAALVLGTLWKMNLALTLFNLLPLPWLDGGKLLVAAFSKSAYARWTANPNLPEGYQGLFRRIYEGPANLLSRARIKTLDQVNVVTRVATLGALGAFYALFFTTLQFPLLFLALPCSYDYWCIREKVRSEEAVEEMMDLMSQWGAALVQIAEDHDAESEVSAYEAEHAMKNAVDQLLEDLMAKEEFRNLSDEDKVKEFMRAYPDLAVKFLKEKVMAADSEEKIREILADPRNAAYMARLEKWLKDHKVFEKMHSPHAKKKLKDSMQEADEKRKRTAGGTPLAAFAPLFLLPLAMAGVPGLEHLLGGALSPVLAGLAALGFGATMLGSLDRVNNPADKFNDRGREGLVQRQILATVSPALLEDAAAMNALVTEQAGLGITWTLSNLQVTVTMPEGTSVEELGRIAHDLASQAEVHAISVDPAVWNAASLAATIDRDAREGAAAANGSDARGKIVIAQGLLETQRGKVFVHLALGTSREAADSLAQEFGGEVRTAMNGLAGPAFEVRFDARDAMGAARKSFQAARRPEVRSVAVHRSAGSVLRLDQRNAARPPAAPEQRALPFGESDGPKWTRNSTMNSELEFWINVGTPVQNPDQALKDSFLSRHGIFDGTQLSVRTFEWINGYRLKVVANDWAQAERIIRQANADAAVTSVSVHPDALNRLTLADSVDATEQTSGRAAPETTPEGGRLAPEPAGPPAMPAKVAVDEGMSERKTVRIEFKADATAKDKAAFIEMHVRNRALRYRTEANALVVVVREARFTPALAEAAQAHEDVVAVKVSAAGWQALDAYRTSNPGLFDHSIANDETHSPLQGADEARGALLQARDGATLDEVKAWAETLRLRLIEADYRGMPGLHLFEAADSEDTAWSIAAAAAAAGPQTPVASMRPLSENAVVPAAVAEAAAPAKPAAEPEAPRRDAHAAWLNFLQTQTLADGKSTLTPKQVGLIAEFLKPVVPPAGRKKHPVIGRVKEMKTVIPILTAPRDMINSTMLVGPAGTGKTAIFEGLAQLMEDAQNMDAVRVEGSDGAAWLDIRRLRGRWFVSLDIDRLLAADEPIKVLLAIVDLLPLLNSADPRDGNRIIILADEMQKLRMDPQGVKIMNALKGPIRDGQISVAGTTTEKEWKEYFDVDDALKSRFEKLNVDEPTVEETAEMLHGAKSYYEWKHDTVIEDEALDAAAKLTDQFDKETHNPRKSVKLVEQAAEEARPDNRRASLALDIREGWRKLGVLVAAAAKDMAKKGIASSLALPVEAYNRVAALVNEIVAAHAEQQKVRDGLSAVDIDLIKRKLAKKTGISAGQLTLGEEDASRYVNMEAEVSKRVVNQDRAIRALANAIRRNKSGLSNPHRPMGKFLFVGPTGTGKTYLVKELARFLFKDPEAYVRFDMSEFMEEHTYMRLVGAPPSYVGFGSGGQLTEAVRKRPYTVILLDEVEKAHPKVWDIFLQILDDGRLTDSEGRTVDFKNTVIIMTSNTGMAVVDAQKYERMLTERWEKLKALDEAEDPALVAAKVERGLDGLRAGRDAELQALEAKYAKARADLEAAAADLTDLAQIMKGQQLLAGLSGKLEQERAAAEARHERGIAAKRAELAAKFGSGGDREAARAKLLAETDEIEKAWDAEIALAIHEGITARFRPEFINRLDEDPESKNKWVIFNRLKKENIGIIAKLQVKEFVDLLRERHGTDLELGEDVMALLIEQGFSPLYGARPMQAAVEKHIIDPLAKWVLDMAQTGATAADRRIKVSVVDGKTSFEMLDKPEKVVAKASLEGAAQALTREVMALAEQHAAAKLDPDAATAPEASEKFFDALLKKIAGAEEKAPAAAKAVPVFNPGVAYPGASDKAVAGEHNDPAKKDKTLRAAADEAVARAKAAGAAAETVDVLQPEAGKPGEGWVKHFIRHAKTEAQKTGAAAPVSLAFETSGGRVRVRVHSSHAMGVVEQESLRVHFSGPAPKDLKAAQQQADGVNMTASVLRDHNLLDLYRRLSAIPGARFGYASDAAGTDYWVDLPLAGASQAPRGSLPVDGAAPAAPAGAEPALTPHQVRERAKTKELFLKVLRSSEQKDNPNVMVAAASGYGMLATAADLPAARAWIVEKGWADRDSTGTRLTDSWPLLMAAALVMKRHGTPGDLAVLERILKLYTSTSHFHIPAKMALIDAVGTLMARSGAEHARAVYAAAKEAGYQQTQLKEAAQNALGKAGALADAAALNEKDDFSEVNPDAFIELMERANPEGLRAFFEAHWPPQVGADGKLSGSPFKNLTTKKKLLILKLVGRGFGRPERDLALMKEVLNGTLNSDRVTHYHAAEAYSLLAAGLHLGANLQRFLAEFMEKHTFTQYDDKWPVLMAYLYTAQKVGGPELLSDLEHAMKKDAGGISSNYEQPFFELPITWAKVMVRNGLFSQYAQPGPAGEDGRPGLSKLQQMLTSKAPMTVAAALFAIALEQQRLGGQGRETDVEPLPEGPLGDLPDLYVPGSSSNSSGSYGVGYPYGAGFSTLGPDGIFDHPGPFRRYHLFGRPPLLP